MLSRSFSVFGVAIWDAFSGKVSLVTVRLGLFAPAALLSLAAACAHAPSEAAPAKVEAATATPIATAVISDADKASALRHEDRELAYVIAEGRAAGKAVLIEFTAEWCAACKMFESRVLPQPEVVTALKDVIWVRYDVETPAGAEAAKQFNANALPLFVVLDAEGESRGRFFGAPTRTDVFVEVIRQSALLGQSEKATIDLVSASPDDAETLLWAGKWHQLRKRDREARAFFERAIRAGADVQQIAAARKVGTTTN